MATAGYVYIMINPAVEGYVKIGVASRGEEQHIRGISGLKGTPASFLVVYDAYFSDCERAERYAHGILEEKGYRGNSNREYFGMPVREAVDAVIQAEKELGAPHDREEQPDAFYIDGAFALEIESLCPEHDPAWGVLMEEADEHYFGQDGTQQDHLIALKLYKQAARLGAPEAFIRLSEMYASGRGCKEDKQEGFEWLKKGARLGIRECWEEMAAVFMGSKRHFEGCENLENSKKCWRNFFRGINMNCINTDNEGRFFIDLESYVGACREMGFDARDNRIIADFVREFVTYLKTCSDVDNREEKIALVKELVSA